MSYASNLTCIQKEGSDLKHPLNDRVYDVIPGVPTHRTLIHEEGQNCYLCGRCGKSYKLRGNLNRHIRYECGAAKKQQVCPLCEKKYSRPEHLREHFLRRHPFDQYVLQNQTHYI